MEHLYTGTRGLKGADKHGQGAGGGLLRLFHKPHAPGRYRFKLRLGKIPNGVPLPLPWSWYMELTYRAVRHGPVLPALHLAYCFQHHRDN